MSTYKAAEFAKLAGVSVKTLQRWDREGRLKASSRTPGNRRLYTQEQLNTLLRVEFKGERVTIAYVRVSSQAQKGDLTHQKMALEQFCIAQGLVVDEWISEIGGGLNFKRPKFTELVDRIVRGDNGPELISKRLENWAMQKHIELIHIQPGKPAQNAYIDRFNRTFADGLFHLNSDPFAWECCAHIPPKIPQDRYDRISIKQKSDFPQSPTFPELPADSVVPLCVYRCKWKSRVERRFVKIGDHP